MSTLTIQIKFINRVKTSFLPVEYKKQPKLPMRLRGSYLDHLNVFSKTILISDDFRARDAWAKEILQLTLVFPFQISKSCGFGDKLIGCINDVEFGDFYVEIYQHHKWIV
jgi:hypothetical protein